MTIFYTLHDKLYVNLTNRCSCACTFCIRKGGDGVGSADSLWLEREPDFGEVKAAFGAVDLAGMNEIVFCGYGEPMERADLVIEACELIKSRCELPVRLNTNGLVRLLEPGFDVAKLGAFDSVSVSLNAADEAEYLCVTQPRFGAGSFRAMLDFARDAKAYTDVMFTVVDVIGAEQIEKCRVLARDMNIPLRIRHFN
jgi:TatD family-associated radical SAM protein